MKTKFAGSIFFSIILFLAQFTTAQAATIFLDGDTPDTGSNLDTTPLVTPLGTVTFRGAFATFTSDLDFVAAGASGNQFNIDGTDTAAMFFDFNVNSISFIYGGNDGVFDIEARDIAGNVVDSFYQADTSAGQPAGPITLAGAGIRSLFWQDPGYSYSAIDNVTVSAVPEPSTWLLLTTALLGVGFVARRRA